MAKLSITISENTAKRIAELDDEVQSALASLRSGKVAAREESQHPWRVGWRESKFVASVTAVFGGVAGGIGGMVLAAHLFGVAALMPLEAGVLVGAVGCAGLSWVVGRAWGTLHNVMGRPQQKQMIRNVRNFKNMRAERQQEIAGLCRKLGLGPEVSDKEIIASAHLQVAAAEVTAVSEKHRIAPEVLAKYITAPKTGISSAAHEEEPQPADAPSVQAERTAAPPTASASATVQPPRAGARAGGPSGP